jgi:thymidylate synthase (FAD)
MKIVQPSVELEWITPNAAKMVEMAGRTCYKSECGTDPDDFVRKIIGRGHDSVLEHACMSVRIICDRGISHEIVRHRVASYSQESTRYCNYSGDRFGHEIVVVQPSGIDENSVFLWAKAMEQAEETYFALLSAGTKPQTARDVLPTSLKTELVMTTNMREWRHFLRLRLAAGAHPDIQIIAKMIKEIISQETPIFLHGLES